MRDLWARSRTLAGKLSRTGFFSVFFSSVLCKVLTFFGGMVVVRVLSKGDYGSYTYVTNCYAMLMLLGDLGCSDASMQFCNECCGDPKKFDAWFVYGFQKGILFSAMTSILLLLAPLFYPFKSAEAAGLTRLLFLMPILKSVNSFLLVNLRIRLENSRYAAVNVFQTIVHYLVILPMSYWIGVTGAVLSNYVIELLVFGFSLTISRKLLGHPRQGRDLEKREKRNFLKLAVGTQLNNGTAHTLMLLDVFLIGLIVGEDEVISSYKVATIIPSALAFIPSSIMVYVIPYFARNNRDKVWVKRSYFKLTLGCAAGNLAITLGGILTAAWIVPWIFGRQYEDAVPCFIVLMAGYFFSATFQTPSQNIIYTQRKVRVNLIITVLSGIANCFLDVFLILRYGSSGAAWGPTLVHVIKSALCFGYMCCHLRKMEA